MANYYWDENSWGADYPPENWADIVDAANTMIDDYIEAENLAPERSRDDMEIVRSYSEGLWEKYCNGDWPAI